MAKIRVVDFLIQELSKLGITHFFGLPGDYCFKIINAIDNNPETAWVGCTNELNAGYAADGYARLNGYGALVTTYNVGELSAINAIGGSMAENVPVIHIVGAPATQYIKNNTLIHHNFDTPDYFASYNAYSCFTQSAAILNEQNAKSEIERLLYIFQKYKKPVYISIPADICDMEIENSPEIKSVQSDKQKLKKAVEHALKLIQKAQSPIVIGDSLIVRYDSEEEFLSFIEKSGLPATTLLMGKGLLSENNPGFIGTYLAGYENPNVNYQVNNSDCPVCIGTIFSDFNTLNFDIQVNPSKSINIQGTYTIIQEKLYDNVLMKDMLRELSENITHRNIDLIKDKVKPLQADITEERKLDFKYITSRLQEFIKPYDCIFSDTGVFSCTVPALTLPEGAVWYAQLLWASIGWATPAVFGAQIADPQKRMILLTGEGAHQLTFQALSSMLHYEIKPVIIVLNNFGYTIERVLSKTPNAGFNDIPLWDYTKIASDFGGNIWTAQAKTNKELDEVLKQAELAHQDKLCYIEIFTDEMELPELTQKLYNR